MKKRKLRERIEQLEQQVADLMNQARPQQCEKCGVLFRHYARITSWITTTNPIGSVYKFSNKPTGVHYIDTPDLCSRCKAEQQAKSA